MEIKTTKQIINDNQTSKYIPDDCSRLKNIIIYSDYHTDDENKKWISVDSLKQVIYEYQQINDLNVGLDEMLIEKLGEVITSNSETQGVQK